MRVETWQIIAAFVVVIAAIIVLVRMFRSWKVERCRETARGTIAGVQEVESTSGTTYYFVIHYAVEMDKLELRQKTWNCPGGYWSHVGEEVTVHYDPEKPKRAWAEAPGKHPYSRFANR